VTLPARERDFVENNPTSAMTTLKRDGMPHTVRIAVGLVDGKLWSSGTQTRARTRHLRRDPRSSLFVFDLKWAFLTFETTVTILDGADAPEQNLALFRKLQKQDDPHGTIMWNGEPRSPDELLRILAEEQRLIYEFKPIRSYGLY
jgi:pyridoxamine 5'-phosphate oxidase-like protein